MEKISVFIITKNEEDRIANIIKRVQKIADEILIIDSGSTDKTCQIANQLGAKVIFNQWKGYGPQKVFGQEQCKNDWILNIDSDEEVSSNLAKEISKLSDHDLSKDVAGFKIKIVNKFPGEKSPKKFAYYYNQLRLYNKKYAGFKSSSVHDSVELKDKTKSISQLNNIIYHQSFRSYTHWIEKLNSYSKMQAEDAIKRGKKISTIKILLTPTFAFLKAYFIRRYFIYGFNGLIYSYLFAFSRFAKMVKIRQLDKDSII